MTNDLSLTEEELRRVAVACFVNAQDLYEDARLLEQHARYPRALSLAVIGSEEFVKSVACTIAALAPKERGWLPQALKALYDHDRKHMGDATIEGEYIGAKDGVDCDADMAGVPVAPGSYLRATLLSLAHMGLQGLLGSNKEAKAHAQALNDIATDSTPSVLKKRGLYVDIGDGALYTPPQLDAREAISTMTGLAWSLETFCDLPSVLEDDRQWHPLAQTIRHSLSRRQ
jgi:AbiV family abortive infection protein